MPNRPARNVSKPNVAIIGAGVIGLGIAWRLAMRGVPVAVFDKGACGAGASHAAAGMLAACAEAEPGEEALVTLGRASQARWPAFAAELKQASGVDVGLRPEGTLVVALTSDDQARLSHQLVFQQKLGLPLQWISAAETRRREPHLAASSPARCSARKTPKSIIANSPPPCALPPRRLVPASANTKRSRRFQMMRDVSTASSSLTDARLRPMWSCLPPALVP